MTLLQLLKTVGKDLKDVGEWIAKAAPVAGTIITTLDPPLAPIISTVETIIKDLSSLTPAVTLTAADLQAITQAVTLLQSVNSVIMKGQVASLSKT